MHLSYPSEARHICFLMTGLPAGRYLVLVLISYFATYPVVMNCISIRTI